VESTGRHQRPEPGPDHAASTLIISFFSLGLRFFLAGQEERLNRRLTAVPGLKKDAFIRNQLKMLAYGDRILMKQYVVIILGLILLLCLISPVPAGKVSSSSGGIGSSQQGGGSGFTIRSSSAGHSATADIVAYGELIDDGTFTGGEFEYTTSGEEEATDDIVSVKVDAEELVVSGSLDPALAFIPGSTVSATAFVRASGDENGVTGVFVDTNVFSQVNLDLMAEAKGEVYAQAVGKATGTGLLGGVGKVSAESDGSTTASAESEGNILNPVTAFSMGQIYGFSQVNSGPSDLLTNSLVMAQFGITNGAEVAASAEGSAKSSADSPVLTGKSSADGYTEVTGWNEGDGYTSSTSQIYAVQNHFWEADMHTSIAQVTSSGHADTSDDDFGSMTDSYAQGQASTSGKDLVAPPGGISSMANTADGGAWSAVSQSGEGRADAMADLTARTVQSPGMSPGSYITGMPGPGSYGEVLSFDFLGLLADESRIAGVVDLADGVMDTFSSGGATAWGSAGTSSKYLLHNSRTSVDGSAGAGGDAYDDSDYHLFGEVSAFNFIDGTTDVNENMAPAGSFDTRLMSGSSIRTLTVDANGDFQGGGFGSGDAGTTATVSEPFTLSTSETSASGLAEGSGHLFSAEIAGITTAGLLGDADFVAPVDPYGPFVTTDSGLALSQYSPVLPAQQTSTGIASGKASASAEMTTPVLQLTGSSEASGSESIDVKLADSGSFTRAMNRGSSRSYYDFATDDAISTTLAEQYGLANAVSGIPGSSAKQKILLTNMKADAEGSFSDAGDFTITEESAVAGTSKIEMTNREIADSWASTRIYSGATTTHDMTTDADLARIDAYYQAYASGTDNANQKTVVQMSGVGITGSAEVTDSDGSAADSSESVSLSLKKGSSKIDFNTGSNKIKITFPLVMAKISGERDAADPEIGEREQTATYQTWSAPLNEAYAQWRARVDTNAQNPAPIVPPQP
jgi:hypothetical protein